MDTRVHHGRITGQCATAAFPLAYRMVMKRCSVVWARDKVIGGVPFPIRCMGGLGAYAQHPGPWRRLPRLVNKR
jgi:hypothetical protein